MPHKLYHAHLKSVSPYGQNQKIQSPRDPQETAGDHEERTWRERMHVTADGSVFIPPMAIKNCLTDASQFLGKKIPGQKNKTYKKIFESGILVMDPIVLPLKAADVPCTKLFLPADGVRGSGKRVDKFMPTIAEWEGVAQIHILNDLITEDVLSEHLEVAGTYVGIGNFRPQSRGYWGRFQVTKLQLMK